MHGFVQYEDAYLYQQVRPTSSHTDWLQLNDGNDPRRQARKIASKWGIDHTIKVGARRAKGDNISIAAEALTSGDFVEVAVSADIVTGRCRGNGPGKGGTVVRFGMQEVVRLWTAAEVQVRMAVKRKSVSVAHPDQARWTRTGGSNAHTPKTGVKQMPSGFRIGENKTMIEEKNMEVVD